jgi:autophagy-related protein 16
MLSLPHSRSWQAVRAWDVATGRQRMSLTGHSGKVTGLACSPADPLALATCSADRTIKVGRQLLGSHL